MRILLIISLLFSLTCNGQSGLMTAGATSENKDTAPASTYSNEVQQVLDRLTNPSLEVQVALAQAIDSLVSYGYWPDSIYMARFLNLDTEVNSMVDLTGNFSDATIGEGGSPGFWIQFVGYKGQFDGAMNTKFNPTTLAAFDITNSAFAVYVDTTNSIVTNTNYVFGFDTGSGGEIWMEEETSSEDITGGIGSAAVLNYNTAGMQAKKLYTLVRPDASNLELWENGTQLTSQADAGSTEEDEEIRLGGFYDGVNVLQEWDGRATAFFVTTSNIVYDSLRLVIERLNARLLPNEAWEETIIAQFEDSLKVDDIWNHTEFVVKLGRSIESKVHNLKDGEVPTLFTDVGSPTFIANKGYQFTGTSGLDTNYQPHDSLDENLVIIWKGTLLTGETTENFLVGSESATATTGIKVSTVDDNVVSYLNATGPVGNIADGIDTTSFFVAARLASDSVKAFHRDTLLNARTRTFVDYPGHDLYIGGMDSANVLIEGSFSIAEWVWVGDTTLLDKLTEISNHMMMVDTTFASNTPPAGDITPPTTPTIALQVAGETQLTFDITILPTDLNGVDHIDIEVDQIFNKTIAGNVTEFTVTGLTASTSYDVRIRAFDGAGNASNWSNELTESTTAGGGGSPGEDCTGCLFIEEDFETLRTKEEMNPPWNITGPEWTGSGLYPTSYIATDPTDAGNRVMKLRMEIFDGTTVNTNYTSRREMEYKCCLDGNSPPRYLPNLSENGFRFRFRILSEHKGTGDFYWNTFGQLHHAATDPQTGGPPLTIGTQDLDNDGLHDLRFKVRGQELEDSNVGVNTTVTSVRDVFAEDTWYYCIWDARLDYTETGSTGYVKFYASTSGWPDASDLILSYEGQIGFNNTTFDGSFPQVGMYWADTRNATRLADIWADGDTVQSWLIDDWRYQDEPYFGNP